MDHPNSTLSQSTIFCDTLFCFSRVAEHHLHKQAISSWRISKAISSSESQKVRRLTGNLRQMEEMRKIGDVRVSTQEQHESLQIDARHAKRAVRNGLQ